MKEPQLTKAEKARKLYERGCSFKEIADILAMQISHVKEACDRKTKKVEEREENLPDKIRNMIELGWSMQKMAEVVGVNHATMKRLVLEFELSEKRDTTSPFWWKKMPTAEVVNRLMGQAHRNCHLTRWLSSAGMNQDEEHPEHFEFLEKCREWWNGERELMPSRNEWGDQ